MTKSTPEVDTMSTAHGSERFDAVACVVITVSDTRTADDDTSGVLIRDRLSRAGHSILAHEIIPDEIRGIVDRLEAHCADKECQCIMLTGGTGISPRDVTYEAVAGFIEKRLDGFGELFRMLSFQEIGAKAILSRAIAGTKGGTLIFAMPGSTAAVQLAMNRLILPTLVHAAALLSSSLSHHP